MNKTTKTTRKTNKTNSNTAILEANATILEEKTGGDRPAFGWSQEQLEKAFSAVQNKVDWKAPIIAWVNMADLAVTLIAIEYFTATKGKVVMVEPRFGNHVKVEANGYRNGPAGDH